MRFLYRAGLVPRRTNFGRDRGIGQGCGAFETTHRQPKLQPSKMTLVSQKKVSSSDCSPQTCRPLGGDDHHRGALRRRRSRRRLSRRAADDPGHAGDPGARRRGRRVCPRHSSLRVGLSSRQNGAGGAAVYGRASGQSADKLSRPAEPDRVGARTRDGGVEGYAYVKQRHVLHERDRRSHRAVCPLGSRHARPLLRRRRLQHVAGARALYRPPYNGDRRRKLRARASGVEGRASRRRHPRRRDHRQDLAVGPSAAQLRERSKPRFSRCKRNSVSRL